MTNTATNIATSATSNSSGDYEVPSLHAGVYTISAKATNYAEAVAAEHHHFRRQPAEALTWN